MHYTSFPSALHSPCLPTFSHLHLRPATLSTFPTSCTQWRYEICWKKLQSIVSILSELNKGHSPYAQPWVSQLARTLQNPKQNLLIQPAFAVVCITQPEIPRKEFGKVGCEYRWILPPEKACGQELHLLPLQLKVAYKQREYGNPGSELLFFPFISWPLIINVNWIWVSRYDAARWCDILTIEKKVRTSSQNRTMKQSKS